MVVTGLANSITANSKKATKASKKLAKDTAKAAKEAFDKSVEQIDDRKYYNQLSLTQELTEWEKLQKKYKAGTEERKKADREVYRVKMELIQNEKDAEQKKFDFSVSWIDEQKYYNKLSLTEELAAWERVQKRYIQGSEERKKADKEVYRVKQEITAKQKQLDEDYYAKSKEINDKLKQDIKDITQEYVSAVDSRTDSLYDAYGLFDAVDKQDPVSGNTLIKNLQGQVRAFESWQQNIDELAEKGIDGGLLAELRDMGPKAASQVEALNKLSASKLDVYVSLWRTKHSTAKTQAISELENLRLETVDKISELNENARVELDNYKKTWLEQSKALTTIVKEEFQKPDWVALGSNIIAGITKGLNDKGKTLPNTLSNIIKNTLSGVAGLVSGDLNVAPTIRPVLDLTEIVAGNKQISSILSSKTVGTSSKAIGLAGAISRRTDQTIPAESGAKASNDKGNVTNKFEISQLVVREEADVKKVARRLYNMQIDAARG
jgi:hypothetical protein